MWVWEHRHHAHPSDRKQHQHHEYYANPQHPPPSVPEADPRGNKDDDDSVPIGVLVEDFGKPHAEREQGDQPWPIENRAHFMQLAAWPSASLPGRPVARMKQY